MGQQQAERWLQVHNLHEEDREDGGQEGRNRPWRFVGFCLRCLMKPRGRALPGLECCCRGPVAPAAARAFAHMRLASSLLSPRCCVLSVSLHPPPLGCQAPAPTHPPRGTVWPGCPPPLSRLRSSPPLAAHRRMPPPACAVRCLGAAHDAVGSSVTVLQAENVHCSLLSACI